MGTGAKLGENKAENREGMELLLTGAGCPMDTFGCPGRRMSSGLGRMSGRLDPWTNTKNSAGKEGNSRQNLDEFVDEICWEDGEKLDPLVANQICGSNPTKLHHTNKSQKKSGFFWWGFSDLGRNQQNQARNNEAGAPKM